MRFGGPSGNIIPVQRLIIKKRSQKTGLPPGTPVLVGERKAEKTRITLTRYTEDETEVLEPETVGECLAARGKPGILWINVDGLHEVELISALCSGFDIHPLTVEDLLNTQQRPKIDFFENYVFFLIRMHEAAAGMFERGESILVEQVSIIFGQDFVLSFQEKAGDVFEPVRARIKKNSGLIRKGGADYLAYSLLDTATDNFFQVLEKLDEEISSLEEGLASSPTPETFRRIHYLRRKTLFTLKSVRPLREVAYRLEQAQTPLVKKSTVIYFRDIYDHTIQIIESVETLRDIITGMMDVYLSATSNRLNEIIKVLTVVGAIFIPLTFITSLYGMNFRFMPELYSPWGYPAVLLLMLALALSMLFYFKKKNWF